MTRIFTVVLALGLLVAGVAAQPSFGVKAGLALADQDWDYRDFDQDFDSRLGMQFGIFAEFAVTDYVHVTPELRYVPVGVKVKYWVTESYDPLVTREETATSRIDYLSIPVLIKIAYPSETVSPYVIVGPRIDFQVGTNANGLEAVYDELDKTVYGLTVGAGAEYAMSPKYRLLAEFSYSPDFSKAYETSLLSVTNKTLSFLIGVRF